MSPAHVLEPTYEAIKRRLMTGEWPSGARLETAKIADRLGVSASPVRDSLYRLVGERMVAFTHGEGFHVHRPTETELRDMLELHLILLLAALATTPTGTIAPAGADGDYPDRIAALFVDMANRSANAELVASIAALGDRLHLTRRFDETIVGGTALEYEELEAIIMGRAPQSEIRNLLLRYHEKRAREAAGYARLLGSQASVPRS
jgi:DNA-binding GntR family transcriptional regulator